MTLSPRRVTAANGTIAAGLMLAALVLYLGQGRLPPRILSGLASLFDPDEERTVTAMFSALLLLLSGQLLAAIAASARASRVRDWSKWAVASLGLLLMALDESVALHERLNDPMRALLGDPPFGVFYGPWVLPAIVVVAVVGWYLATFLQALPKQTRRRLLLAAGLYLGGAIGVETIAHAYEDLGGARLGYGLMVVLEESLELTGAIVCLHTLMLYVRDTWSDVTLTFEAPAR